MRLFVFGLGYTALAFAGRCRARFSSLSGTVRSREKAAGIAADSIRTWHFEADEVEDGLLNDLEQADALLVSVPPDESGDPVLARLRESVRSASRLRWIGYLSTIGVYGDHGGAWIDEAAAPAPADTRTRRRIVAERDWLQLGAETGKAVQVFRLSVIYGPRRNALVQLAAGTARRLVKPGQVFNRIHVDDIAAALAASLDQPRPGAVFNVTDDEPAPPQDVVAYAAALMGVEPPPAVPFEEAVLSPMAASFYGRNKRVSNRRLKEELGVRLAYPTYREGLAALHRAGEGVPAACRSAAAPK